MPAAVSYAQLDADSFSHRPRLPPSDSDEADKWPPTDSRRTRTRTRSWAAALLGLLPDVDPPSQRSQRDERQGTWRLRPQVAEDIMRHHPRRNMSRPLRSRTSRRGMRIGMHVIPVVLTSLTDIPVRHALHIRGSRTTTSTLPGRMHSSTSIKDTNAQLKSPQDGFPADVMVRGDRRQRSF
jgi:hypothetical protein